MTFPRDQLQLCCSEKLMARIHDRQFALPMSKYILLRPSLFLFYKQLEIRLCSSPFLKHLYGVFRQNLQITVILPLFPFSLVYKKGHHPFPKGLIPISYLFSACPSDPSFVRNVSISLHFTSHRITVPLFFFLSFYLSRPGSPVSFPRHWLWTNPHWPKMEPLNLILITVGVLVLAIKYFNQTDVPKIKNLPEIPGIPIFGNLIQLGDEHAKKAREWVKKYGDVFQVRLGNKVCTRCWSSKYFFKPIGNPPDSLIFIENHIREHIRLRKVFLDQSPILIDLSTKAAHIPHRCLYFPGVHHRNVPMGWFL